MAKSTTTTQQSRVANKVTRPGVHSKTKTSHSKNATNYSKRYRGQGR